MVNFCEQKTNISYQARTFIYNEMLIMLVSIFIYNQFIITTLVTIASGESKDSELVANTKYTPDAALRPR